MLIRSQVFDVNNGNEDKDYLINPSSYGLQNAINVYFPPLDASIDTDRIGGWYIKSEKSSTISKKTEVDDTCQDKSCDVNKAVNVLGTEKMTEDDCVFILMHGNAKNRGAAHRIAAYKIFQSVGCDTLTMDYRGYGDSTMSGPINETTVVEDAKAAIKLIRDNAGDKPKLILYGHSMGTGIAARAAAEAMDESLGRVDGIILDSPFHSFRKALETFWISKFFDLHTFLQNIHLEFDNVKWLSKLDVPVRIFHATSDPVTPIDGAKLLLQDVKETGHGKNVDMVIWEEKGLSHIGISTTKTFKQEILSFVELVKITFKSHS